MAGEPNVIGNLYTPRDALSESDRMSTNAQALAAAQSAIGHLAARVAVLEDEVRRTRDALGCANLEIAVLRQIIRRRAGPAAPGATRS